MKPDSVTVQDLGLASKDFCEVLPRRGTIARASKASSIRQIRLIATKELSDRFRSGWVIACALVWLGAIGLTSFLGLLPIGRMGVLGYERTVISLLNLVQYLVPLLGLLLGHDLIVGENEERTLRPVLAAGVSRRTLLFGKWFGGCLSLGTPLLLGFALAGSVIGLATNDHAIASFLRLAVSGLSLGIAFLTIGFSISTFCRTRVQSLVLALLTWCVAVFVFDLVALGCFISAKSPAAVHVLEVVCDATHINGVADIHAEFDISNDRNSSRIEQHPPASLGWLAVNPVDLFRATNLTTQLNIHVPPLTNALALACWLGFTLGVSSWRFRRIDL